MRKNLRCPKCQHQEIWHVDTFREQVDQGDFRPLPVVATRQGWWRSVAAVGEFEVFICAKCGFAEWYAKELGEIRPDEEGRVRLLSGAADEGPYR
jgi:predicted nucleic-acid-binding Zn-ribbon protein